MALAVTLLLGACSSSSTDSGSSVEAATNLPGTWTFSSTTTNVISAIVVNGSAMTFNNGTWNVTFTGNKAKAYRNYLYNGVNYSDTSNFEMKTETTCTWSFVTKYGAGLSKDSAFYNGTKH